MDPLSESSNDDVLFSDIEHLDSSEEENFNSRRDDSNGDLKFVESDGGGDSNVHDDDMAPIPLHECGRGRARGHGRGVRRGVHGGGRLGVPARGRGIAGFGRDCDAARVLRLTLLADYDNADLGPANVSIRNPEDVGMQPPADSAPTSELGFQFFF